MQLEDSETAQSGHMREQEPSSLLHLDVYRGELPPAEKR